MIPKKDINQHQPQKAVVVAELSREHCNKSSWCCLFPMGPGSILSPAQAWAVVSRESNCGSPTELLCPESYWGFII